MKIRNRKLLAALSLVAGAIFATPAAAIPTSIGTEAIWSFDLPGTAIASQNPPYPSVASLRLLQTADGVQFTLTPAWNVDPSGRFGTNSQIERLNYVFDNGSNAALTDFEPVYTSSPTPPLSNTSFRWDGGAPIKEFDYIATPQSMDTGYTANDQQIVIDFFSSKNNDPDASRFDTTFANSIWTVLNRDLTDFTETSATANSKPSPTQGIISVTAYSLKDLQPTPSNWVTGPNSGSTGSTGSTSSTGTTGGSGTIPEPGTLSLLGLGMLGGLFSYRRRQRLAA